MRSILLFACCLIGVLESVAQTRYTEHSFREKSMLLSSEEAMSFKLEYPISDFVLYNNNIVVELSTDKKVLLENDYAGVEVQIVLEGGDSYIRSFEIKADQASAYWLFKVSPEVGTVSISLKQLETIGGLSADQLRLTVGHSYEFGFQNVAASILKVQAHEVLNTQKQLSLAIQEEVEQEGGSVMMTSPYSYYQVELLRLYPLTAEEPLFKLSWEHASSVVVKANKEQEATFLQVPITSGEGYYAYRLRAVSEQAERGLANKDNYGQWTLPDATVNLLNDELKSHAGYFYFSDGDSDKNYIYSRIFTEAGKTKETVTFADRLLNSRQSLVYLPSENKVIRTQTVHDYSGRPVITTLPVPDANEGRNLSYQEKLATNAAGEIFSAADFDRQAGDAKMNLGSYYSGNNSEGVAADQGYGYSRISFYNDGSGRVYEQAGVGQTHALGNKTTKTLYGSAVQSELDYLFGGDAPLAENVFKTYTIDPNNVVSVSYTNKEGQVIGTGLSVLQGVESQLEAVNEGNSSMLLQDAVQSSIRIENSLESTKRIILPSLQNLNLGYRLKQASLEQLCGSIELDCQYLLELEVYKILTPELSMPGDSESETIHLVYSVSYPLSTSQENVSLDNEGYLSTSVVVEGLEAGTYLVRKKISPGEVTASEVSNSRKQVEPILNMVSQWLDKVESPAQMQDFYAHLREFGLLFSAGNLESYQDDVFTTALLTQDFKALYEADKPSFKLTTYPTEGDILVFNVSTTCCANISVPVDWEPPFECPESIAAVSETPDFLDWATDRLASVIMAREDNITSKAQVKSFIVNNYMKGWSEKTFKLMTYHMLTDVYSGSASFVDESTQEHVPAVQYSCDQLFKCWSAAVASLKQQYDINFVDNSQRNVSDKYDERQDSEGAEGHDMFIDKKALMPKKGPFKKWRAKRRAKKVSRQVRNLRFPQVSGTDDNEEGIEFNLVKSFLDCSGFRFAKILTPFDPEPLPEDQLSSFDYFVSAIGVVPYRVNEVTKVYLQAMEATQEDMAYVPVSDWVGPGEVYEMVDESGNVYEEFKPFYPFIKNPVYAFKYFQYDGVGQEAYTQLENSTCFTDPNDCYVVSNNRIQGNIQEINGMKRFIPQITTCCEGEGCVDYPNYPATGSSKTIVAEFCDYGQAVCGIYPGEWTSEQRLMFYNKLKTYAPEEFEEPFTAISTDYDYATFKQADGIWYELSIDDDKEVLYDQAYENGYPAIINQTTYDNLGTLAEGYSRDVYYKPIELKDKNGNVRSNFSFIAYLLNEVEVDCNEGCESKRSEIERKIYQEMSDKCYELDGCYVQPNGNVVLRKDISLMVDQIIEECKSQCTATTFSFELEDCRMYNTPKYSNSRGSNITGDPSIEIGVAKAGGYSSVDNTAYLESYTENGRTYYRFAKYQNTDASNLKVRYQLSLYEATLLTQVSDWELEIIFPCQCPDLTSCPELVSPLTEATGDENTYVNPQLYMQEAGLPAGDIPALASPAIKIETTITPSEGTN